MIDLTCDEAGPSKRPRTVPSAAEPGAKRARASNSDDDIAVVEPVVTGPSTARGAAALDALDGDDVAITSNNAVNANRDLPHSREHCAAYKYTANYSRSNSAYCPLCYCAVCDKPAKDCSLWGDGSASHHHCNLARRPTPAPAVRTAAVLPHPDHTAIPPRHVISAAFGFGPRQHLYDSGHEDDSEGRGYWDSDEDDYYGCRHGRRRRRMGRNYEDEIVPYFEGDDDELDGMLDEYGRMRALPPVVVNPWTVMNDDSRGYEFKRGKSVVPHQTIQPDDKPVPVKLTPITFTAKALEDLVHLGTLDFPVKVHGATAKAAQGALAAAPWGYTGLNFFRDWRSWEAYFGKKWCLASVYVQQLIPAALGPELDGAFKNRLHKDAIAPELPKKQMELLPLAPLASDPQPVPVDHVTRLVMFIDCCGKVPLQLVGVDTVDSTTLSEVQAQVTAKLLPKGLAAGETLIFAKRDYNTKLTILHEASFKLSTLVPSHTELCHTMGPLVCWRAAAIPPHWNNSAASGGAIKHNVHYVCVETYVTTESVDSFPDPHKVAGLIPVPVLIPACKPRKPTAKAQPVAELATAFDKANCKLITDKVCALFAKWARPGQAAAVTQQTHLQRQLFRVMRAGYSIEAVTVAGHNTLHARLDNLVSERFCTPPVAGRYSMVCQTSPLGRADGASRRKAPPCVLMLNMVWDALPAKAPTGSGALDIVSPDTPVTPVAAVLFDLEAFFNPPRHASAAADVMATTIKQIKQRREHKEWISVVTKLPMDVLRTLLVCSHVPRPDPGKPPIYNKVSVRSSMVLAAAGAATPVLRIEVFTHKSHAFGASALDAWDAVSGAALQTGGAHYNDLMPVLQALLRGSTKFRRMKEQLAPTPGVGGASPAQILEKAEAAKDLQQAPQPAGITVTLHKYQRQSLQWMLEREATCLRDELWVPLNPGSPKTVYYSPLLNKLSLDVAPGPRGGFLAEEMGLGKTIEVLSLVLQNPAPCEVVSGAQIKTPTGTLIQSRATLVVCKVSLVGQWVQEARSKVADQSLSICEYHGPQRVRDVQQLAKYDIVVTTYDILASDSVGRSRKSVGDGNPCAKIKWWRLVMDESHTCKDASTKTSKALDAIQSDRRWACSGTPFITDTRDLSGQLCALHFAPLHSKGFQLAYLRPTHGAARSAVVYLLRTLMIRHSKAGVQDEAAMRLPPKTEQLVPITLTAAEWKAYTGTYKSVKEAFDVYARNGPAYCNTHQLGIMALLTVLRRLSAGGSFAPADLQVRDKKSAALLAGAAAGAAGGPCFPDPDDCECSICMDDFESPMRTPCGHWFCCECIQQVLAQRPTCPLCRTAVAASALRPAVYPEPEPKPGAEAVDGGEPPGPVVMDSKVKAVIAELRAMRATDPTNKALIFTQFNDTLKYLTAQLLTAGFAYRTISGAMSMKQRAAAIAAFQSDPPTTVFVLSVRAGAVGITLTAASTVIMMEPLLNSALDEQAVGRAWRMGQKRPVVVKRLFVKGSVEETIMDIAKARKGSNTDAHEEWSMHVGRRAPRANAGALKSDRANLKFEELNQLFAPPKLTN